MDGKTHAHARTLLLTYLGHHNLTNPNYQTTDFGTSPGLLFQPCDTEDDQCYIGKDGVTYKYDPLIRLPVEGEGLHEAGQRAVAPAPAPAAAQELAGSTS